MNRCHAYQLRALALVEAIKKWLVLEVIGVDFLVRHSKVFLQAIGKYAHLQFDSFFCQRRFDEFQDLGVRHRLGPHHQIGSLQGIRQQQDQPAQQ